MRSKSAMHFSIEEICQAEYFSAGLAHLCWASVSVFRLSMPSLIRIIRSSLGAWSKTNSCVV